MKTLIVYATRHGSSEKAANMLQEQLKTDVTSHNILENTPPELTEFNSVIIGGSIHAGEIQSKVKSYIKEHSDILRKKHLGLFLCCMDKEKSQMQFENAFPEELRESALASSIFGGEFVFEKMNWFEKSIIKKITGIDKSVSKIDSEAIKRFSEKFNLLP